MSKILHSNPAKHLMLEHQALVQDFTEEHAKEYSEAYKGQPLSFLLENSRYIFSEPYYGYAFYKEQVLDTKYTMQCIDAYSEEKEKVQAYLTEHGSDMNTTQVEMYESLIEELDQKQIQTENLRMVKAFVESLYEGEELTASHTHHPMVYFLEAPFAVATDSVNREYLLDRMYDIRDLCLMEHTDEDSWKTVFESTLALHMLCEDPVYVEAVHSYTNRDFQKLVHALKDEPVMDMLESVSTISSKDIEDLPYSTPTAAVNTIFALTESAETYREMDEETAKPVDRMRGFAYDLLSGLATFEYTTYEDVSLPNHIGYVKENGEPYSISQTYHYFSDMASRYVVEKEEDDVGEPSETVRKSAGYELEDKPVGKKSKPPVPKSAARKIQNSFMDKEAKAYTRMADAKAKGEEIKGAARAVGAIPLKVKRSIDDSIKKWDDMDDERRRKYIIKPGFRKKAFRNLKLAMLYGASASYSLLMVPITMIARHYSKQKDRRIRNQLARELNTEIEICKEKIQDASSNGDNKEKYKLMRIKSKLEQERTRVLANSRYV